MAGVAPGLVHYYFASKDLLLQEVLQMAGQRYVTLIEQMLTLPPRKLAKEILQEPQTRLAEEPEWYRFRYELLAIGLHNDAVAPSARMMLMMRRREKLTGELFQPACAVCGKLSAVIEVIVLRQNLISLYFQ